MTRFDRGEFDARSDGVDRLPTDGGGTAAPDDAGSVPAQPRVCDAPDSVRGLFGAQLAVAERFATLLSTAGVERGLIGPREVPILWTRHLGNCALLADLLPQGTRVVDVGSGGGLPGLVLAIRRPDLRVELVEPMLRRTTFLTEAVDSLGLSERVRVVRGRAEEKTVREVVGNAEWVTARAVAPLERLVRWSLPLLSDSGTLLALKGERARSEVHESRDALGKIGARVSDVQRLGEDEDATWVVRVQRGPGARRRQTTRTARRIR